MSQSKPKIWTKASIFSKFLTESMDFFPKETGGLIFGYYDELGDIVITEITGSGPKSVHNYFEYIPDYQFDNRITIEKFENSKGLIRYLGDWHTHPIGGTNLSDKDKTTLKKIADDKHSQLIIPLMIIVGLHPFKISNWTIKENTFYKYDTYIFDKLPF